jgi:hypothetical protein
VEKESLTLNWSGPHRWPKEGRQPRAEALNDGGVYLFSIEHHGGFLVYCAGHTQQFWKRFRQHDRLYRNGTYSIFDHDEFAAGRRVVVWPGFWMKKSRPRELSEDFVNRGDEIRAATERWLDGYRVFVARVDAEKRIKQRLEAGLMSAFMNADPPACDMPDKGMSLSSRWPWESPIRVKNISTERILGLPPEMEA